MRTIIRSIKRILNKIGRTFMPHLYDLNPKLEPKAKPLAKKAAAKKAQAKKAKAKKK